MERLTRGKSSIDLPAHMIKDKFAITDLEEDPEDLINYTRANLRNRNTDAPSLQHEDPRQVDSTMMINIRTEGGRSEFIPDHSEEFIEVVERDTRGPSNEPNWRHFNDQRRARGKNIKFSSDADNSRTETVVTNEDIDKKKRNLFQWAKERMLWFTTSKDGRATGSGINTRKYGDINYVQCDDKKPEYIDSDYIFGNFTTNMSNTYRSGWYNVTDHEFAVAKYGPPTKNPYSIHEPNNYLSRFNTAAPQFDSNSNMKVALQIMKSATDAQKNIMCSASPSEYTELAEQEEMRLAKRVSHHVQPHMGSTLVDNRFVESMVAASKNNNNGKGNPEVKGVVERTRKTLTVENHNIKMAQKKNTRLRVESDQKSGPTRIVLNYSGLTPKRDTNKYNVNANLTKINGENFTSAENVVLKTAQQKRLPKYKLEGDKITKEFGVKDRMVGRAENIARTRTLTVSDDRHVNFES